MVALLAEGGAEIDARDYCAFTPLHFACQEGHLDVASVLLDRQANIEARNEDHLGEDHFNPLMVASQNGHPAVVSLLLERQADISARDKNQHTALHIASSNDHQGVVALLLA